MKPKRTPNSTYAARHGRLVSLAQKRLAQKRLADVAHEVDDMEQLAANAAAKSEAASLGQLRSPGVLEAAYRVGCRAYMLHKDC